MFALEIPLSLRRQTNVSLSLAVAEKMERFAKIFHRGEFAPVARVLIEEALRHVATEADYLDALKCSAVDEEGRPSALLEATHGKTIRRK
jgi:spermidine synthase